MRELELYVHIPFCMKKCAYCDFLSAPADEKEQFAYMEGLLREIAFYGKRFTDTVISTVYIGGDMRFGSKAIRAVRRRGCRRIILRR